LTTHPLAILDTSVIVLMLSKKVDESPAEIDADRRREAVREKLHDMQAAYRFGIPAVVVAELGRGGDPESMLTALVGAIGRFRVLPLTRGAAVFAAKIRCDALAKRPPGTERGAITYDALICGTAFASSAECVVIENPRDFEKHFLVLGSSIDVVIPSQPPRHGQVHMMQVKPKKAPPK